MGMCVCARVSTYGTGMARDGRSLRLRIIDYCVKWLSQRRRQRFQLPHFHRGQRRACRCAGTSAVAGGERWNRGGALEQTQPVEFAELGWS